MQELINLPALFNSLKRLWWVPVLTLAAGALVSGNMARRAPKFYQANTLILVEPQKIPSNYVKPIVTTPIETRLKTIQQQVTSRSRIETIIREQDLFPEQRERVPMEDLVARVNRGIRLEVRGTSTFRIYYEERDPQLAARIANAVAQLFISENVNARRAEARSTTLFLEQQLAAKKLELERQEALITEFNRTHMSELPDQRDANYRMLEGLRGRFQSTVDSISKEEDRKILLESQLADIPSVGGTNVQAGATQLDGLRQRLIELRGQYTEQHPEVSLVKRQIADLEAALAAQAALKLEEKPDSPPPANAVMSVREQQLTTQISEVKAKIRDLNRDAERLKVEIADYESRVNNAPKNEQTLLTLKRDYDILQQSYLDLLKNKTAAEMAETLEQERQGEQFIVLDRAVPPVRPSRPNIGQIVMVGCALGLVCGIGIALLFDILRPRFRTEDELVAAFGIPVLVAVPDIARAPGQLPRFQRFRRLILGGTITGVLFGAGALVAWLAG